MFEPETVNYQLEEFRKHYGYEWPNCSVPDCEYKTCVPFHTCYQHLTPEERAAADEARR